MSDPFTTANAAIFASAGTTSATVTQGTTTYARRALLSLDVESVDMASGAVERINIAQFPRVGGLKPEVATITISGTTYVLKKRLTDDGYAETWRIK